MSRVTTPAFKSALYAQETGRALIYLLTLTDETGSAQLFTNNSVDILSNGKTYVSLPFDISLPASEEGRISKGQLTLDNVTRTLIDEIRSFDKPFLVRIDVVLDNALDEIVATWQGYELRSLNFNATSISGELSLESYLNEPYPKSVMGGKDFPGLFFQ